MKAGLLMMAGIGKFLLSMFGLLIVHHGSVEAILTMNQTCAYYSEGYIADPDNCQNWGYCKDGQLLAQGSCGTGLLYDVYNGICNYASKVQCSSTAANICANLEEPGFIAVPSNCNQYCYCSNNKIIQCNSCPTNQLYNPTIAQCQYDYSCPTDSACRLVKNNDFVGADKCGEYMRCHEGSGTPQKCSNGYFYNNLSGMCQPDNPCTNSVITDLTPSEYSPTPSACSAYVAKTAGIQYFSDGATCYGYYSCGSAKGTGTWRRCEFGTHFNPTLQKCVSPMSYACLYNRCGNVNLQFVTAALTSCQNYYVCSDQKESAISYACPNPKFPYFDEVVGGCVETDPGYAICSTDTAATEASPTTIA